jgi:hypothetical protein
MIAGVKQINSIVSRSVVPTDTLIFNKPVIIKEIYASRGVAGIVSITFDSDGDLFNGWTSNRIGNFILGSTTLRLVINRICSQLIFNSVMDITVIYEYVDEWEFKETT